MIIYLDLYLTRQSGIPFSFKLGANELTLECDVVMQKSSILCNAQLAYDEILVLEWSKIESVPETVRIFEEKQRKAATTELLSYGLNTNPPAKKPRSDIN